MEEKERKIAEEEAMNKLVKEILKNALNCLRSGRKLKYTA